MSAIDNMPDDTFMAVTEALGIAGEAMDEHQSETLLIVSLSSDGNNAILGGKINEESLEQLRNLLDELEEKADNSEGEVLHIWT